MVSFIREYLLNVCAGIVRTPDDEEINIAFQAPESAKFICVFTPIELSIVFDNLLSNSRKHHVKNIAITILAATDDELKMSFKDDGVGVPKRNAKKIFEMGFSTTNGSGLGLYHVADIIRGMKGEIQLNVENEHGAEFLITFRK